LKEEEYFMVNLLTDFRFLLAIDNIAIAGFSDVSGLEKTIETEDHKEGGNDFVHKLPKGINYGNLTLKRGLSDGDNKLWKWHLDIAHAISHKKPLKKYKKNITLIVLDEERKKTDWIFTFKDAYPIKWTGPSFNAKGDGIAIEALEIVHTGFERS